MTKKRKQTLGIIVCTVIWTLAIQLITYAGYLAYRDVNDEIADLKIQVEDGHDRLVQTRAELGLCRTNLMQQMRSDAPRRFNPDGSYVTVTGGN